MRKLIIGAAVIALAAAFLTTACKKPVFVPEEEVIPEDPDEPGVYEEGLYVTEKGAGMFTGEDWNNAMSVENLRTLLFVTGNTEGKTIHLEQGSYSLSTPENPSPTLQGNVAFTIKGGYKSGFYTQYPDRHPTYLSGGSDRQIIIIGSGTELTLDAVGFTGGIGAASGAAAVRVHGGKLKMTGGVVRNNFSAYTTGAVQVDDGGEFEAESCRFEGNVAQYGGVLNVDGAASVCTLNDCSFTGNAATSQGGAIKVTNGSLTATNCTFKGNHAEARGGALWLAGSKDEESVIFRDCVFEENSCVNGGGVGWQDGGAVANFSKCVFRNNFASNGSAGSFYLNEGSDSLLDIEDCEFSGNHCAGYRGGSFHLAGSDAGAPTLVCRGTSFNNESSETNGGVIALRGTGPKAYFDHCTVEACHAGKNSGVFYSYATGSTIYWNACTFKGNYIDGTYGTECAVNQTGAVVGMNNCSVADDFTSKEDASSQQACWYNIGEVESFTISNCTFVGVPLVADRELSRYGLLRMNSDATAAHLINSIVVSTVQGGFSLFGGDTQTNLSLTGLYNWMSPVTSQKDGTFTYTPGEGDVVTLYSDDLPGLTWDGGWKWNGPSGATASTAAVNSAIQSSDSVFYEWLEGIAALGKDIRSKDRGSNSWPGSYQD